MLIDTAPPPDLTLTALWDIVEGLSNNDKMPGYSWGISAHECQRGAILALLDNTPCQECYAKKNRMAMPVVQSALGRRLKAYRTNPLWDMAMVRLIQHYATEGWFRWFDSGDLQDTEMLLRIMRICDATPRTRHWMPTREVRYVEAALATRRRPKNLALRLSATFIDGAPPTPLAKRLGVLTSGVSREQRTCPAQDQDGQCKTCRNCWDQRVKHVVYPLH